jgi:hypothetical protein
MSKSHEIVKRVFVLEWRSRNNAGVVNQREFTKVADMNERIKQLHAHLYLKVSYNPPHYNLDVGNFWCSLVIDYADGRVEIKKL